MLLRSSGERTWRAGLAAVLVLAAGLRIYSASTETVEGDELFTQAVASGSVRTAVAMILDDRVHPPLHYLLVKALGVLSGTSPHGLRLVSVLSGILLVTGVAFVARALLADAGLALLAAALVALSDYQLLTSHFARPYSLLCLLGLIAAASLWTACLAPLDARPWIAYVVAGSALLNTNYNGWAFLLGSLPVIMLCDSRVRRRWLLATGAIGASLLPWTLLLVWYARDRGGLGPKLASLDFRPGSDALLNAFAAFNGVPAHTTWAAWLTVAVGGVLFGLAVARAIGARRDGGPAQEATGVLLMASLAVLPPVLLWTVSGPLGRLPLWGIRHLSPSFAPWILVVCAGVSTLRAGGRRLRLTVAFGLIALQGAMTAPNTVHGRFVRYDEMARFIAARPAAVGPVLTLCELHCGMLRHYLPPGREMRPLPRSEAELPATFWLVYQSDDAAQVSQVERLRQGGWSVTTSRDYRKRCGGWPVVRAALLTQGSAAAEQLAGEIGAVASGCS